MHEQFITDTARYADFVLPATTQIEATDVVPAWGHLWLGWNEAAIEPLGEAVSNSELFRRLAGAMGFTEPSLFDDDETIAPRLAPDVDLDELRRDGLSGCRTPTTVGPLASGEFPTASGKVELVSDQLDAMGSRACRPTSRRREPRGDPALAARYPLQLLTPKHHTRFLNSSYSHLPKHGPLEGGPFIELDPADAAARGASSTVDCARVWNDRATRRSCRCGSATACAPAWWPSRSVGGEPAPRRQGRQLASPTTRSPTGAAAWRTATPSYRSSAPTPDSVRPR